MSDDVVAGLDRWLGQWESGYFAGAPSLETIPLVQRARDEIVALRKLTDGDWVWKQITGTRAEALEEAAQACVGSGAIVREARLCAAAIRALKDKGQ